VSEVNGLVDRFFEARKMMQQMAGGMGLPGMRRTSKTRGKKGKKGKGRGPTPPKVRGGMPALPPGEKSSLSERSPPRPRQTVEVSCLAF